MTKIWPDRFVLNNKVAVVTGGAGLIGKSVVKGFSQAGAKVIVADNDERSAKKIIDLMNLLE